MPRYRRYRVAGGTYFFTVALANRSSEVLVRHVDHLRTAFAATRARMPFRIDAIVILPDHLHTVWTLPDCDSDFPTRWRSIKTLFTRNTGLSAPCSTSKQIKGERGLWQRRFWEHCIRDEKDFRNHVAYCWANPVKHGLVAQAVDWPYSSIHRDIRLGRVPSEWGAPVEGDYGE